MFYFLWISLWTYRNLCENLLNKTFKGSLATFSITFACIAKVPADQNRGDTRSALYGKQQTSKYNTSSLEPGFVGPFCNRKQLCSVLLAKPLPPTSPIRGSLLNNSCVSFSGCAHHLFVLHTQLLHLPRVLQSTTLSRSATLLTHTLLSLAVLEEAFSRFWYTVFLQRGCCCQDKEVVPNDHISG